MPKAIKQEPGEAQINKILREKNALQKAKRSLTDALELAEGWIDANREDESTGEGQQAKWILDTIRAAISEAKGA